MSERACQSTVLRAGARVGVVFLTCFGRDRRQSLFGSASDTAYHPHYPLQPRSIDQLNARSLSPIAVPLLGVYPGVATSAFLGKDGSGICNPGEWSMTFENCDPTMGGMGMACVEGAPTMYNRPDGEVRSEAGCKKQRSAANIVSSQPERRALRIPLPF